MFASSPVDFYFPSSCFFGHFLERGVCQEVVCRQLRVSPCRPARAVGTVGRSSCSVDRASSGRHESPAGLRRCFWRRNSATAAVFALAFSYPSCRFVICLELRGFSLPAGVGARGADVTAMTEYLSEVRGHRGHRGCRRRTGGLVLIIQQIKTPKLMLPFCSLCSVFASVIASHVIASPSVSCLPKA